MPLPTYDALRELAGQGPVERYGLTETLIVAAARADAPRRPGTVGTAISGVDIRKPRRLLVSEFVLLFRASEAGAGEAMGTPERAQRAMSAWLAWVRELEATGHLAQPGQPLAMAGRVVRGPDKVVTDGPFVEIKDIVLGFMVIRARDAAEAEQLAKGCPMLAGDGSVEIRPVNTIR